MKRSVLLAVVLAGLIFAVNSYVWAEKAGEVTAKAEKACELLAKARVAYKAKKYKQVIECCSEALKINPKLKNARYSRGLAYYCLGKYDKAQSDFIRVTLKNPRNHKAVYYLGVTYLKAGKHALALNEFEKANEISPCAEYAKAIKALSGYKEGIRAAYASGPGSVSSRYDDPDADEQALARRDPAANLPEVECRDYWETGKRLPSAGSLDRLFGYCHDYGLDVRLAFMYLLKLGILPRKTRVGGGKGPGHDIGTVRIYETHDQSGRFYVTHDRQGRVRRWGSH